MAGSHRLFAAIAHLTENYFGAKIPVLKEHIISGSGCGSVIDSLASCLCDIGDGILISKPFYNGNFDSWLFTTTQFDLETS